MKYVLDEVEWDKHESYADFRYNTRRQDATGVKPHRALHSAEAFEFDALTGLQRWLDEEPEDAIARLVEVRAQPYKESLRRKHNKHRIYDKPVQTTTYEVGE